MGLPTRRMHPLLDGDGLARSVRQKLGGANVLFRGRGTRTTTGGGETVMLSSSVLRCPWRPHADCSTQSTNLPATGGCTVAQSARFIAGSHRPSGNRVPGSQLRLSHRVPGSLLAGNRVPGSQLRRTRADRQGSRSTAINSGPPSTEWNRVTGSLQSPRRSLRDRVTGSQFRHLQQKETECQVQGSPPCAWPRSTECQVRSSAVRHATECQVHRSKNATGCQVHC
jgi:hypothetical protein